MPSCFVALRWVWCRFLQRDLMALRCSNRRLVSEGADDSTTHPASAGLLPTTDPLNSGCFVRQVQVHIDPYLQPTRAVGPRCVCIVSSLTSQLTLRGRPPMECQLFRLSGDRIILAIGIITLEWPTRRIAMDVLGFIICHQLETNWPANRRIRS